MVDARSLSENPPPTLASRSWRCRAYTRRALWIALGVSSGCFSPDPPSGDPVDSGSTSGTESGSADSGSTDVAPTTSSTSGSTSTTEVGDESSTTGGLDSTTGERSESSSGAVGCREGEIELEDQCVTPLLVTEATYAASQTVTFSGADGSCLEAACPDDEVPLAGGFFVSDVELEASNFVSGTSDWAVCGSAIDGAPAAQWQSVANCTDATGTVLRRTSSPESIASDTLSCVDFACPEGAQVVGGGGRWSPWMALTSSRPTESGWRVCGLSPGQPATVEIDVHCGVLAEGTVELVEGSGVVLNGETSCATASCGPGGFVLAGGASTVASLAIASTFPEPGAPDQWRSCAESAGNGGGQVLSWALCLMP